MSNVEFISIFSGMGNEVGRLILYTIKQINFSVNDDPSITKKLRNNKREETGRVESSMSKFKVGDKVTVNSKGIADEVKWDETHLVGLCTVVSIRLGYVWDVKVEDSCGNTNWYSDEMLDFAVDSSSVLKLAEAIREHFYAVGQLDISERDMLMHFSGYIDGVIAGISDKDK